jgi:hypothetical protein
VLRARRTFLADEQGLGKTVQALAALEADDAFPPSCLPGVAQAQLAARDRALAAAPLVAVVSGTGPVAPRADITIINYEIVHAHRARLALRGRARSCSTSRTTSRTRAPSAPSPSAGSPRALAPDGPAPRPDRHAGDEPPGRADRRSCGSSGRLGQFGSGRRFARRFRASARGADPLAPAAARASCRRSKADVPPAAPRQAPGRRCRSGSTTSASTGQAEDDVIAWLREQPLDLRELEAEGRRRAARGAPRPAQRAARLAARGKCGAALGLDRDFLASDEPLVVFAGHREVQDRCSSASRTRCTCSGATRSRAREAPVRAFQAGGPQLLVCATRVAGQGITLTRASNVAFLDLEWTPAMHDQAEDRCHRIGQRDAVTAWYLLAAETIDETMLELIARKRGIVGAVTDGRTEVDEGVLDGVIKALRGKPARHLRAVS